MEGPSDHELVAEIQTGRRDALGILFDRYSPQLYEFIYLIIGDRDQSARLLEDVFVRVPGSLAGLSPHESVRGWLYSLAREASLTWLRQKNWLDALPPSEEPTVSGLPGDIWRAARSMPAFHRAVLVVEELHGLSPTEKARALNIARTDLPRLIDDARRSFNSQFDLQARQQGRPLSSQVDPERIWGIHRRIGTEGSLFGYLPSVVLPDSLAASLRNKILASMRPGVDATPIIITEETEDIEETEVPVEEIIVPPPQPSFLPEGCSVPVLLTALLIALLVTSLVACLGYFFIRDSTPPSITRIEPADRANIPPTPGAPATHVIIAANYQDDRAVDARTVRLVLDSREVTGQALISDTSIAYPVDLDPGTHVVQLELRDSSGNRNSRTWQFTIQPGPEPTPGPSPTPTVSATPTITTTPGPTPTGTRPAPPIINNFMANQTNVRAGTPVLLTWSVSNADIVFLNQEKVDPVSSRLVTVNQTTDYHLIANNSGGTTDRVITIQVTALPDLVVNDITTNPAGQVIYTIRNVGSGDVTQMFLIQVLVDGLPVDSNRRISSLPAGQEVSLFVPNYLLIGTHAVTVRLNSDQSIQEGNTNNNELTRTLVGLSPSATWTPTLIPTWTPTWTPTTPPTWTPTWTPTLPPTLTPTRTPTNTPTLPAPQVSGVTATLTSTSPYTGTCPPPFPFMMTGTITTTGATTVNFRWERSDGINNPTFSLVFPGAGTQTVSESWANPPVGTHWERLHVLTPNEMFSNQVFFSNQCH